MNCLKTQSFRHADRVTKKSRYQTIYKQGVRRNSQFFTIITCGNTLGRKRLGITVTKKAGNAVNRNRIKRLVREFFRLNRSLFPQSHDILVMARKNMPPLTYRDVCIELTKLFGREAGR